MYDFKLVIACAGLLQRARRHRLVQILTCSIDLGMSLMMTGFLHIKYPHEPQAACSEGQDSPPLRVPVSGSICGACLC